MKTEIEILTHRIKGWILFFMVALVISGITAFPLETELNWLTRFSNVFPSPIALFVNNVYDAIRAINRQYPFLAYGTDWLAFAHIVIAVVFIGPYKDPVRNIWVIEFGMISCLMIFPLAFICGWVRQIPVYWQLIDCSFGMFGLIPLLYTHHLIKRLEKILSSHAQL
jgi:hypothetical protein